jgi:hypothetical protein
LYEAAQNVEVFSKILDQNKKNKKSIVVDVIFQAYPLVPLSGLIQSGPTVPLKRHLEFKELKRVMVY